MSAPSTTPTTPTATPTAPPGPRPDLGTIRAARDRIRDVAVETPLVPSVALSRRLGREVFLKLESFQTTGSFKIRGATSKIAALTPAEKGRGVICASAGNHGQGVACAAQRLGIAATVVIPVTAPYTKARAIRGYGAKVILHGESYDQAFEHAQGLKEEQGLTYVHAYDDPLVVAGQGTLGLELLRQLPEVGTVLCPIGGGGLCAGVAIALKALRPNVRLIGVTAAAAAAYGRSLEAGEVVAVAPDYTIADGIRVKRPGGLPFQVVKELVDEVVSVTEDEIGDAVYALLDLHKVAIEGAGAAPVAALLAGKGTLGLDPICAIVSGGNIDLNLLTHIIERGLTSAGTYVTIATRVPDRPGQLMRLLERLANRRLNILDITHHRAGVRNPLGVVEIELTAEAGDPEEGERTVADLKAAGYEAWRVT